LYRLVEIKRTLDVQVLRLLTNKTDHHHITEILLKVALNTIIPPPQSICKVDTRKFWAVVYFTLKK